MTLAHLGEHLGIFLLNGWMAGLPLLAAMLIVRRAVAPRAAQWMAIACAAAIVVLAIPSASPDAVAISYEASPARPFPLAIVWIAVAAILLLRDAIGHSMLARAKRSWTPVAWRGIGIFTADEGTPMTVGRAVFIPRRVLGIEPVIRHELDHARWRDPLVHGLLRTLRILCWPVLPLLALERIARAAAEEAADRAALRGGAEPVAYAETLLSIASWPAHGAATAAALTYGSLEERVRRILRPTRPRLALALLALLAGAAATNAVPVAALAGEAAAELPRVIVLTVVQRETPKPVATARQKPAPLRVAPAPPPALAAASAAAPPDHIHVHRHAHQN